MRVEKADVGLDVVAATESTKFVGSAAAVEHAHCFPGTDLKNPARFGIVRTPGSLGAANFDTADIVITTEGISRNSLATLKQNVKDVRVASAS